MRKNIILSCFFALFTFIGHSAVAQSFDGHYGLSQSAGGSWLDLRQTTTFESGTCMRFVVGGAASKMLIRFLRVDDDPNRPIGILDGIHDVPNSRELVVKLSRRFANIKQISIHGNPKAWHYDLGSKNGPANLERINIVNCQNQ